MRYKDLPQNEKWLPEPGYQLLEEVGGGQLNVDSIGGIVADQFRVEDLHLDAVGADYMKYVETIHNEETKKQCLKSWDKLRSRLEKMPRKRNNLPRMNLKELPKQGPEMEVFEFVEEEEGRGVGGIKMYDEKLGSLRIGDDVAIYTKTMSGRPWIGRVMEIKEGEVSVQWFQKKSARLKYEAQYYRNGKPYIDTISRESIIYINVSAVSDKKTLKLTPTVHRKIMDEYEKLDETL